MKVIAYLLLTILVMAGPAFMAAPTVADDIGPNAITSRHAGATFVADRHGGGPDRSGLHENHHFRHPGFSHDRHFRGQEHQRFLGKNDHRFRGHDRLFVDRDHLFVDRDHRRFDIHTHRDFGVHDHRNLLDHDRHFFGDRHGFIPDRHPHLKGYVPRNTITACYRTGSVLVCYGG